LKRLKHCFVLQMEKKMRTAPPRSRNNAFGQGTIT
jgi:hypothetical protein